MSLEWARARALQNAARLKDFLDSGDGRDWNEVTMISAAIETLWVSNATLHQSERLRRACHLTGAADGPVALPICRKESKRAPWPKLTDLEVNQ
jgi:hypothetical protein